MASFDNGAFRKGVRKFMKRAGVEEDYQQQFEDLVVRESDLAAEQVKQAGLTGKLTKEADLSEASDLEKAIVKVASDSDSDEEDEDESESEKSAASMGSGQGSKGRKALAERFLDGDGEFDHSSCYDAMKDESDISDAHRYCRDLAKLVGRGHEATRGPREGKQPGE